MQSIQEVWTHLIHGNLLYKMAGDCLACARSGKMPWWLQRYSATRKLKGQNQKIYLRIQQNFYQMVKLYINDVAVNHLSLCNSYWSIIACYLLFLPLFLYSFVSFMWHMIFVTKWECKSFENLEYILGQKAINAWCIKFFVIIDKIP